MAVFCAELEKAKVVEAVTHSNLRHKFGNFTNTQECYKVEILNEVLAEIRRLCALTLVDLHAMRLKLKKMLNWAS